MSIELRNTGQSTQNQDATAYAKSYDNNGNFLVVGITADGMQALDVKYDDVSLVDAVGVACQDGGAEIWYMVAPPQGAHNLIVYYSSAAHHCMMNIGSFAVVSRDPPRDTVYTSGWNLSLVSVTLTPVVAGDLCVYQMGVNRYVTAYPTGCTLVARGATSEDDACGLGYEIATGTSETGGFYWNSSANAYAGVGAAFSPGGAGHQIVWIMSKMRDFFKDLKAGLLSPEELQQRYRELKSQGLVTI